MRLDLKAWSKTPDGLDTISTQKVFCIGGRLWQGWKGDCIQAREQQLSTRELKDCKDVDGTINEVWLIRRQRLEGRYMRKSNEMDDRRAKLRRERNEIRTSIAQDKELGINANPADTRQIDRIDRRMDLLEMEKEDAELLAAQVGEEIGQAAEVAPETVAPPGQETCDWPDCGAVSPPGHKNPKNWARAHKMGKHTAPAAKAAKKAAQEGATA